MGILTEYCRLKEKLRKLGLVEIVKCRFCEKDMRSIHIVTVCVAQQNPKALFLEVYPV